MNSSPTESRRADSPDAGETLRPSGGRTGALTAALVGAIALLWLGGFWVAWHHPLSFDDSFMFLRYATNMRQGLGMSWNRDGVHTYGETALLWGWVIYLFSYLPARADHVLRLASWIFGAGSFVAIGWAVAASARSYWMRSVARVVPMAALPLMAMPIFMHNSITGMETMLAVTLTALFVGITIRVRASAISPVWAAVVGLLLFMARPEMALVVVLMPTILLSGRNDRGKRAWGPLGLLLAIFFAGVLLEILCCKLYFKSGLPLSFYMKSRHAYEGYQKTWFPLESSFGLLQAWPYLLILAIWTRRSELRLVLSCMIPLLAACAYLSSVTQIMGMYSRYYVPYLVLIGIPALLVLDRRVSEQDGLRGLLNARLTAPHIAALGLLILLTASAFFAPASLLQRLDRRLDGNRFAYDPVEFKTPALKHLPRFEGGILYDVPKWLVAPLPPGASVAASEVGYLGYVAPQVNVIDLAGLNDGDIALHGFSMDKLLNRKPDIIWMPHDDYTYQRGVMFTNPNFLREYDFYPDAATFGLAIRKESPYHAAIESLMQKFWEHFYPGIAMESDRAESVSWSGQKRTILSDVNDSAKPATRAE